jgi:crotonobetainyl-CoA:carnitine CoA-transferase CaiB-like acyl-CoA transferase
MSLGALEPKFWLAFCAGAGLEADMGGMMPGPHQPELRAKVAAVFKTKTRAEWEAFAKERDCCLEPVLTPEEATRDAHLAAREMFFEDHGMKQFRTPFTPRGATFARPPKQGEHTDAILRECGLSDAEIAELRASGAAA